MSLRLLILAAALTLAGCETFTELDPADFEPQVAVDGQFETGVPWSIRISRTTAINDTSAADESAVLDALVEIGGDDGSRVALSHVGEGRYESPGAPVAGRTYTLRVRAPGFPEATATSTAPRPAEDLSVTAVAWPTESGPVDLEISFDDPESPGDLYELSLVSEIPGPDGQPPVQLFSTFTTTAPVRRESTFLDDIQSGSRSPRYLSAYLDDEPPITSVPVTVQQTGPEVVTVTLAVASPEYYELVRSQVRQREAARNPFAEPVPPYSNVRGGFGTFVGLARRTVAVERHR